MRTPEHMCTPPCIQLPAGAILQMPAVVLSIRATEDAVLVLIQQAGAVRLVRVTRMDEPELAVLSPSDRARCAHAVCTLLQAKGGTSHGRP